MKKLGIDIGSHSIASALLDGGRIVSTTYAPHLGRIRERLEALLAEYGRGGFDTVGLASSVISGCDGVLDPTLAAIEGARRLVSGTRNVLSVGGERFFLAFFDEAGRYLHHVENPPCASGTGSFIEQQAERLGISVEELARRALAFTGSAPAIATRCAVFAKSDIIHAMQEGHSLDAVAAGLCQGIARHVLDALLKGRELRPPLVLVGGVSRNAKFEKSLQELAGVPVLVPEHSASAGAVGAALLGRAGSIEAGPLFAKEKQAAAFRPPLRLDLSEYPDFSRFRFTMEDDVEIMSAAEGAEPTEPGRLALGFDIGSTSTKSVAVDKAGRVLRGFYTRTLGDPVAAMQNLLRVMKRSFGGRLPPLSAVGVTGSGRKMIAAFFRADLAVNEITAHAAAARRLNPAVDTIIEIGGQDSKLTLLQKGEVSFAQMNYVCAAGTGSFIEEQARRLGLSLEELSELALRSCAPLTSDRCTVYMERDLTVLLGRGYAAETLAASVLYSVRDNYLAKVVQRRPLGNAIVFQGATARNKALVAAFEEALKKPIAVSPYCHLTGAIGAALLAMEGRATGADSTFAGLDRAIVFSSETCTHCANRCQLTVAVSGDTKTGWGMKCGREYEDQCVKKEKKTALEKRFDAIGLALEKEPAPRPRPGKPVTLLDGLYNREYNPLWRLFLARLGFESTVIGPSKDNMLKGKRLVNSDFCAPMIAAHGLAAAAVESGSDAIFFPALVNDGEERGGGAPLRLFREKTVDSYFCYYSQYLPTILASLGVGERLVAPLICLNDQSEAQIATALHGALVKKFPDLGIEETKQAFAFAAARYREEKSKYRKRHPPPASGSLRLVLLGRPYAVFDPAISLNLPAQLEALGAEVLWQAEIDTDEETISGAVGREHGTRFLDRMHWKYGRDILQTLAYVIRTDGVYPVFLSCFRCSPDSFLLSYAQEMMKAAGKPFLFLGLDELASNVGYTTRIEAACHAFRTHLSRHPSVPVEVGPAREKPRPPERQRQKVAPPADRETFADGDTVLIPNVSRLIARFWAECFNCAGFKGEALATGQKELTTGYAFVHGGECLPVAAIVGGMIEKMRSLKPDPAHAALYLPTLCMACNFPQFPIIAKNAAREAGFRGLKVPLVNSMSQGEHLPGNLSLRLFEAGVTASLLYKLYFRRRPYEKQPGAADEALRHAEEVMAAAFREGRDTRTAFERTVVLFREVETDAARARRPRLAIVGDFYVKYNETVNQNLQELIMKEGGELVIPSFTETTYHFFDVDARANPAEARRLKVLRTFEARYEKLAADLIGDTAEPEWDECTRAFDDYGLLHYLPGETSLNTARVLNCLAQKSVEAIVHINPMFCCPGVVSSSLFKKISRDFGVPIMDIFYDGTGDPNKILVPHLHYLLAAHDRTSAPGGAEGKTVMNPK